MTAPERAPLGAALALLLALVSLTGSLSPVLMAICVGVLALLVGVAWPSLLELPSPRGTAIVISAVGIVGAALAVLTPERFTPMSGVVMVCAVGVFASFVQQMLRPERRDLTASLTGTVAGVFVSGTAACWALAQTEAVATGRSAVIAALALGLATTLLLNATPLPFWVRLALSFAAGTAVTAALAIALAGVALPFAIAVGVLVAVGSTCAQLLVGSSLVAKEPLPSLAVGAVPVATVGVVAHLAALLIP
ncbi:hypothetical protein CIK81_15820 [Brachybacterium sp. JB7]|uniref:hypothetical protein n=1 Tax=Brachybacterium TaxID=43668 RepID=UPI000DF2E25F|nr:MULTISPECIES: hypothetical protein [Brachybacterium]RCS61059.1 hypothetical protein CIK81_15820 [Brachybacterium sp. JB7]RCS67589.1 hypothetical protein CIK73_10145 [Brachybacterium alimentarium]RCS69369.1 hypothetical protein CIK68_12340 [Brachybacterium alimentarium]RCS83287.1 hypothetical protein CIK67_12565 [Brachybacterium alimentarium]